MQTSLNKEELREYIEKTIGFKLDPIQLEYLNGFFNTRVKAVANGG